MNFMSPYIGNVIIPTDEVTFVRGVGQPPLVIFSKKMWILISFTTSHHKENVKWRFQGMISQEFTLDQVIVEHNFLYVHS